ncbi:MAG: hypothetical protein LBP53_03220 [Candidatus Peribacteria bacterium]|nr:hypothetical protein [Candidatus Peribacteria bacterium]
MTHPPYMYQRNLPLVYRNERYFEDVHRWRLYGEIPVKLSPDSEKIQTLKAIVNDGKEHLFDIVETVMLGGESYGDGVAFWKLLR